MNAKKSAAAVAAAAFAVLISGCGSETAANNKNEKPAVEQKPVVNQESWPKATPEQGLVKGLSLPLETYMQTYQDTVALESASRDLQENCMAEYGFSIKFPPAGTTPPPSDNDANIERRYGLTDREAAARYGYGLPAELTDQPQQKMPELTDEQVQVLTGHSKPAEPAEPGSSLAVEPAPKSYKGKEIHDGGCLGWAKSQLNQPTSEELTFVSELNGNSFTESMQTPVVKEALAEWSQCMKAKGYTASTPFDAAEIVPHTEGGTASREEIAVALAEIDCKEKTGLIAVWFAEESKIQKAQIAKHQDKLNSTRTHNRKAGAAAKAELVR